MQRLIAACFLGVLISLFSAVALAEDNIRSYTFEPQSNFDYLSQVEERPEQETTATRKLASESDTHEGYVDDVQEEYQREILLREK